MLLADQLADLVQHLARPAFKAGQNTDRAVLISLQTRPDRAGLVDYLPGLDLVAPVLLTQNQLGR